MKRFIYISILVLAAAACSGIQSQNPYDGSLNVLTVNAVYPEGFEDYNREGLNILVEDMNTGSRYTKLTDAAGSAVISLPDGLYRLNISGRFDMDVFNGAEDRVVIADGDVTRNVQMSYSKAGSIIIKELYCGGCKMLPQEGDYQADQDDVGGDVRGR